MRRLVLEGPGRRLGVLARLIVDGAVRLSTVGWDGARYLLREERP